MNSDGSTELISSSGVNISNLYDLEISDVDNNGYQDLLVFNSEAIFVLENYGSDTDWDYSLIANRLGNSDQSYFVLQTDLHKTFLLIRLVVAILA